MQVRLREGCGLHPHSLTNHRAEHLIATVEQGVAETLCLIDTHAIGVGRDPRRVVTLLFISVELDVQPVVSIGNSADFVAPRPTSRITLHSTDRLDCRPTLEVFHDEQVRGRTQSVLFDHQHHFSSCRAETSRFIGQTVAVVVDQVARPFRLIRVCLRVTVVAVVALAAKLAEPIHVSVLTESVVVTVDVGRSVAVVVPSITTDFVLWCPIVVAHAGVLAVIAELQTC